MKYIHNDPRTGSRSSKKIFFYSGTIPGTNC